MKTMIRNRIRIRIVPILLLLVFAAGTVGVAPVHADILVWHSVNMKPGDTYDVSKAKWNTTVFIKKAGDYTLKGKSEHMRVLIECGGVNLYLADGLNINCSSHSYTGSRTAAIWVKDNGGTVKLISKKKATITLEGYMCPAIRKEGTDTKLVFETEDPNNPGTIRANSGSTDWIRNPSAIGSKENDTGNITFNSGNVIAKIRGTNSCGAAIGGAEGNSASNITVNGGHVEAYGSEEGAAIGGGAGGVFTGFYVNGGEVYAENQVNSLHIFEGAAIGGGVNDINEEDQTPGNIGAKDFYIKGGTVTAVSHGPGAAIGGGTNSGCSNINIEGGTVNATCDSKTARYECYGAGIGGGYGYQVKTEVNISGGNVTAKGGPQAPGIGSQDSAKDYKGKDKKADTGTFRISGGTIYVGCGEGARGDIGTRDSKMIITGGNLHALSHAGDAVNGDGDAVHRVEISFDEITDDGHAISDLTFRPDGYSYGMNDVFTLSGKLHAWLPNKDDMDLTRAYLDSNGTKQKYGGAIPFSANAGTLYPGVRITLIPNVTDYTPGSAWGIPGATALEDMIPPIFSKKGYKPGRFTKGTNKQVAEADGTLIANVSGYTDANGGWIYNETNDLLLSEEIEAIKYKVKFNANVPKNASTQCSGEMANEEFTYGTSKTLPPNNFDLPGYGFDGWTSDPAGTGHKFNNRESINTTNQNYLAPDQDGAVVTLYAQWKPKEYTITFQANNSSAETHTQTIAFDTAGKLDPVAGFGWTIPEGNVLHGWAGQGFGSFYDDGEDFVNLCQMDNGKPVLNEDGTIKGRTLYAQWVETEMIRVSITKDGVPQEGLAPYLFLIAETDGPDPMVLRGLFKEVGSGSSLFYQYAPQDGAAIPTGTYELWFDTQTPPDDSDAGPAEYLADSVEITYGDAYAVSTVFDYHTVGIEADPAYGVIGSVAISDAAGVLQPSQNNEIFAPDGHELVIETVTNPGYHFDGYSALGVTPIWEDDDPGKAGQKIEVQGTADIMAHGAPNDYTVKFDGNGSNVQGTMPDQDMVYGEPQNLFANQFTRPGGFFAVWTTNQDGSGDIITDKQSVENLTTEDGGAVTLYAQWNMTTFNIDYDLNGGLLPAGKTNPDRYWADSQTFTLNAPVKEDYDFTGWMGTGLSNPVKKLTIKEGSVGDRAFIATWAIKQFTVKFVDNGGTGVDEQIVPIHKKAQKPKNPTRAGYAFKGWYADKKLTKAFDFNKEITKDTAVYAKWKKNSKPAGVLIAKVTAKGKKSMVVSWNKVRGAKGYDIFLARCDGKDGTKGMKKVKTVKAGKTLKWTKTGLKKKTAYKAYVKAYTVKDGKKKYIKNSPLTHAYTSGASKKYSNAKALTVNKTKVTLKKGKTFKIKAKVTKVKKSKKLMPSKHVPTLRYISDNKKIAIVSKAGKITAKAKGTCAVYVYTHNGISKKIQVTVK